MRNERDLSVRLHASMAWALVLAACAAAVDGLPAGGQGTAPPALELVGEYDSGLGGATEIVSVQAGARRAILSSSERGTVDLLDLAEPARPERVARFDLGLAAAEELVSVAFHPREPWFLAAVRVAGGAPGRVELRGAGDGRLLRRLAAGSDPDAVAVDPAGRIAAVACEGETFHFDRESRRFTSPPGSVTLIDLSGGPERASARQVDLPSADGVPGFVTAGDGRFVERAVDWNGNGVIDAEVDFDGDGEITVREVVVGTLEGREVRAVESDGETFLLPLVSNAPAYLEPEVATFSPDGRRLYVTLQENNGLAVIDTVRGEVTGLFGLGVTRHAADLKQDGRVAFEDELTALREPDGIAVSADGRFLYTADEGDTDPKVSKLREGQPTGGGRTLSIFGAADGRFFGDTGGQIDTMAAAAGLYPDGRSDAKGSEPEMVVAFELGGRPFAAVTLERAGAVALVDAGDPRSPRVVAVAGCGSGESGRCAPEGIAHFRDPDTGEHWLLAANEGTGTLTVFRVR